MHQLFIFISRYWDMKDVGNDQEIKSITRGALEQDIGRACRLITQID